MNKGIRNHATSIGLMSIILWSTMVGLIHSVSELLGPLGGIAMIYTFASAVLLLTFGVPKIKILPRRYVLIGGLLFAAYEISFALAIGYASNGTQAIEVNIINYLWPCLTIIFAMLGKKQQYDQHTDVPKRLVKKCRMHLNISGSINLNSML